jgi:hypothetical protein
MTMSIDLPAGRNNPAIALKEYAEMVKGPGKFEGEARYVPYYWECYLDGWVDSDDGETLTFNVNDEDKGLFSELKDRKTVKLIEDSQGFVCEIK